MAHVLTNEPRRGLTDQHRCLHLTNRAPAQSTLIMCRVFDLSLLRGPSVETLESFGANSTEMLTGADLSTNQRSHWDTEAHARSPFPILMNKPPYTHCKQG